ncbi:MAG: hypothetical protein IJW93_06840 [Clostridia bacterium]|nr:hypothetical protein [Clostridia bacterium]
MAITLLASRGNMTGSEGISATGATNSPTLTPSGEKTKNNGGILGGIGYVGEKLAVGVVSSLEGMTDYVGSGFAKLFGNDEWAEEIIKTDWFGDWYSHPEEWFNPDKGWRFAGDVAGGIGTSLPAIGAAVGTAAAVVATGGAAGVAIAPGVVSAASGGASFLTAGLGAAGRSTKEAYEESGELTGKEYGYGALTGITEGGIEAVSNIIGMGSGALVKNISKSFAKETGEAIAKQGILKTLGASFAGEAFEEGVSEWIDPYWKRATYDQDAENASLDQIAYSALVGGFSGMLMGGTGYVYDSGKSFINGNKLSQNGGDTEVIETARYFSAFEEQNQTGDEAFTEIKSLSDSLAESLKTTGGKVTTVGQKRQLGALSRANVAASMKSFVAKRAVNIVNNAPVIAERLSAYGYKTPDGKSVSFTAQEITAGYDPVNPGSIFGALKTNEKLRSLAVADATGQLMIDSAEFTKSTLMGERLASQVDLNRFVESASKEEIAAVSRALNIESWGELSSESFAEKITEYINAGGVQQTIRANEVKNALKAMPAEGARPIPKLINLASDGSRRYSDGDLDIAVSKQGDSYTVYNYSTDTLSKSMTRKEINSFLREYSTQKEAVLEREREQIRAAEQVRSEIAEVDSYVRENITDYANLNAPSQSMIRRLIREGRAKGVSESDLLTLAKISAHSGIDIVFSKEQNYLGVAEDGSAKYADGFYEAESNRIVVNPEGKRSYERLLIHELDHAIRRYLGEDGKVHTTVFKDAIEGVSSEAREKILKTYKSVAASEGRAATVMDETNAYYAEQVLTNRNTLERLIEAKPSLKDKILSFFKGASDDYADTPKLSATAKKYYRTYKKLFDEFSARNAQNSAAENAEFRMQSAEFYKNAENSQKTPLTNINQGNMNVSGRDYTIELSDKNEPFVVVDDDILSGVPEKDWINTVKRNLSSKYPNGITLNNNTVVVNRQSRKEMTFSKYMSWLRTNDPQAFSDKLRATNNSDEILNAATGWISEGLKHPRQDNIVDFARGNVLLRVGQNDYSASVIVGTQKNGTMLLYDIIDLKQTNITKKETVETIPVNPSQGVERKISNISGNSIPQTTSKSNPSGEKTSENSSKRDFALDIESENVKLRAEWEGDRVFLEEEIEERLYKKIDQFKYLKKNIKNEIIHDLWVGLNESRSAEERKTAEIVATNKIVEAITLNPGSEFGLTEASDRQQLTEKVIKVVSGIAKSYKLSERVKLEKTFAQQAKTKANAEKREAIAKKKAELTEKAKAEISQEKEKVNARAEKTIEREKNKIETEKTLLKAEYKTDRVYNEKTVEKRLYDKIEQFKYLKKEVKEKIVWDLWHDLNESNGMRRRNTIGIEYTVKIVNEILHNPNSGYDLKNPSDRQRLNESVSKAINGIIKTGRLSTAEKLGRQLKQEAKTEANAKQRILNGIHQSLKKIDDRKTKRFMSVSSYKSAEFKKTIEALTKMDWRGNFSTNIAKDLMNELREWYSAENEMLFPPKKSENDFTRVTAEYNPAIASRLLMLSRYEDGDYGVNELKALDEVISYFVKLVDEYDKVYIEGKWQDGEPLARELADTVKKQETAGVPVAIRALRNKILSFGFRTFGDPLSVMKAADMYENGIFTRYYNEWTRGEINADAEELKIKEQYDRFMKKNRKYLKNAETETVKLGDAEIRKIDLISYAMTLKRKQAWKSIAEGGVVFTNPKDENDVHLFPTPPVEKGRGYSKRLEEVMKGELNKVMSMLSDKDIEYMKVLEAGFELAKTTKAMGDMQRLGFVSVVEGYYYPVKHAYTEHLSEFDVELISTDRYANASFNKSTNEEANSAIKISSADAMFNSHVKAVSRYLYLSPVMDSFNKLYKLKMQKVIPTGDAKIIKNALPRDSTFSLQSTIAQSKTAWRDNGKLVGFEYLQNLMLDTMGMGKNVGDDFFAKIRGGSVGFALGANPKVLVTQLSSLISSTSVLSLGSHIKAIGVWNGNLDDYSVVAKLRNSDYTIAKAEGVIDKISTSSRIFTAGISLMDRFVVYRAWAACQAEVAKKSGPAIGTEKNRVAAGKLLDKVILETQQNSLTSRRTEGARRGNILTKTMQMYKSDSITSFGRAVDYWGECSYLKALLKNDKLTDAERTELENRLKEARKGLGKAVGSIAGQAVFMMLVTEMFRSFYGKNEDETEEEKRTRLFVDAVGNLINGVPVLSELWSTLTSNFGFDSMEFSALNDFFDTVKEVRDYTEKRIDGKATERDGNRLTQDMLYSAGQLLGIPFRNIKNLSYGVVRMFSKDAAYKWDNALYKKNFSADLNEAVADGDMSRATMIMELTLGEKLGSGFTDSTIKELTNLASVGEKIIPSAIGDTITVDGEEITLSNEQIEAVSAEYSKVIDGVNALVESKLYKSFTDEQKARALRRLYATYKDISYDAVLGTERNKKATLIYNLLPSDMFNAYLALGSIESGTDVNGETISGSKRKKAVAVISSLGVTTEQKLLLICASGYALKDGDIRGVSASAAKKRLLRYIINLRGLTVDERAEIAEMCGFEVKNGRIVKKLSFS